MRDGLRLAVRDPFWWLVALTLSGAFLYLRRTTTGLAWPYDVDLFRDIGQADAVLRGELFADAAYAGELNWYNPLLSWLLAAIAWGADASVHMVATQGGVVLNLLAPLALTVLVRRWFGRLAAGFALIAFVFLLCGTWPSWAVATYSPWLFQANFAQGLFYLALLALPSAVTGDRRRSLFVFGALLGLVALAHTAPALLLVAIFLAVAWIERRSASDAGRRVLVVAATSTVIASPFLVPLAWRYRFRIRK